MVAPREPNSCYVKYGIEHAIDGKSKSLSKAVEMIKKVDSEKITRKYEGSAEDFLMDFMIGYMDAMKVKISRKQEVETLPVICGNCISWNNCYSKTNVGYRKREP